MIYSVAQFGISTTSTTETNFKMLVSGISQPKISHAQKTMSLASISLNEMLRSSLDAGLIEVLLLTGPMTYVSLELFFWDFI